MQLQKLDIVSTSGGGQFIITDVVPSRRVYPYVGVKTNGCGTGYKLGPKHGLVKVGVADPRHPALVQNSARKGGLSPIDRESLADLFVAVDSGDLVRAKSLVDSLRHVVN